MSGTKNLIPMPARTESEQKEIARKGGIASGISRKKVADVRKTIQNILDGTYTDADGSKHTGAEKAAIALYTVATDPKHKQFVQAQRLLYEMTGQHLSKDDRKRIQLDLMAKELENDLLRKKIEQVGEDW